MLQRKLFYRSADWPRALFPPRPNGIGSLGHNKNVYRRNVLGYLIGPFSRATPGRSVNVFLTWLTDRYCGLRPVDPFSSNVTERPRLFGTLCTRERSDDGLTFEGRPAATRPRCRPSLLPGPRRDDRRERSRERRRVSPPTPPALRSTTRTGKACPKGCRQWVFDRGRPRCWHPGPPSKRE